MDIESRKAVLAIVREQFEQAVAATKIVKRSLVSQLDHAAYLGRELVTAARSLRTGQPYVQDRAPGDPTPEPVATAIKTCGPDCASCH